MNEKKRQTGLGLAGWIIATPFILLGLLIIFAICYFIYCEANKAYWDRKVFNMCEKYGGITIYEKVYFDEVEYKNIGGKNGVIPIQSGRFVREDALYQAKTVYHKINSTNPKVAKRITEIIRKNDKKILGKRVTYIRIGGDFPTIITHPTSYSCNDIKEFPKDFEKNIFIVKGDKNG